MPGLIQSSKGLPSEVPNVVNWTLRDIQVPRNTFLVNVKKLILEITGGAHLHTLREGP